METICLVTRRYLPPSTPAIKWLRLSGLTPQRSLEAPTGRPARFQNESPHSKKLPRATIKNVCKEHILTRYAGKNAPAKRDETAAVQVMPGIALISSTTFWRARLWDSALSTRGIAEAASTHATRVMAKSFILVVFCLPGPADRRRKLATENWPAAHLAEIGVAFSGQHSFCGRTRRPAEIE